MSEWTRRNALWQSLGPYDRAAVMALMEADGGNPTHARNALGAMVNRAQHYKEDLGAHVSRKIYQPTIEPAQEARLQRLLKHPAFGELRSFAEGRMNGTIADNVNGATHFLAHPNVMMKLSGGVRPDGKGSYVGNSNKYYSWPRWTGYNPQTNQYAGQVLTDGSHAFLIPKGYGTPGQQPPPTIQQTQGAGWRDQPAMASAAQNAPVASGLTQRPTGAVSPFIAKAPGDGYRDQPPMASATQNAPVASGLGSPFGVSNGGAKWGNDHYGDHIQWGDGSRSYQGGGGGMAAGIVTGPPRQRAASVPRPQATQPTSGPPPVSAQPQNYGRFDGADMPADDMNGASVRIGDQRSTFAPYKQDTQQQAFGDWTERQTEAPKPYSPPPMTNDHMSKWNNPFGGDNALATNTAPATPFLKSYNQSRPQPVQPNKPMSFFDMLKPFGAA